MAVGVKFARCIPKGHILRNVLYARDEHGSAAQGTFSCGELNLQPAQQVMRDQRGERFPSQANVFGGMPRKSE